MRIRRAATLALRELAKPSDRDCCVYARLVLRHAFGAAHIDAILIDRWHLIAGTRGLVTVGPWEPVRAAEMAAITEQVSLPPAPPTLRPGRWHLCQAWRATPLAPGSTGHTFLWLDLGDGWGELLDSTRSRGPRLAGLQRWDEYATQFRGGIAVAMLRQPGP